MVSVFFREFEFRKFFDAPESVMSSAFRISTVRQTWKCLAHFFWKWEQNVSTKHGIVFQKGKFRAKSFPSEEIFPWCAKTQSWREKLRESTSLVFHLHSKEAKLCVDCEYAPKSWTKQNIITPPQPLSNRNRAHLSGYFEISNTFISVQCHFQKVTKKRYD